MIYVQNRPNSAGVYIYGDYKNFGALYESLHIITDGMDEHPFYAVAQNRVMAICYDLRYALMGDREIEFVDNGIEDYRKKMDLIYIKTVRTKKTMVIKASGARGCQRLQAAKMYILE